MSLSDDMRRAATHDILRLHTPGHKGKLCDLDLTELVDESFPSGYVAKAERHIASHYGAKHARMLPCGSSQGVKSSIFFARANGIADVNSHRSVFDGFKLSGKTVTAVGRRGDILPITADEIASALDKARDIGIVIVTSPTYYGYVADIDGIRDLCAARGILFVIDGAHGAHFGASPLLPPAFADKCDICNVSAHKTLSALTQSAVLLDNLDDSRSRSLFDAVDIMGTTSPSYLLYASIDGAVRALDGAQTKYAALYEPIAELKRRYPFLKNDDFTRPVLDCSALGVCAKELNNALCRRGVYGELADSSRIVFIFTAEDDPSAVSELSSAIGDALSEIQ